MALWKIWQGNFLSPILCFLWLGWKKKGRLTTFLCWVRLTTHSAPNLTKRNLKRESHVLLGLFEGTRVEKWMSELTWGDLTFTLLWTYALNQPTWHSTKLSGLDWTCRTKWTFGVKMTLCERRIDIMTQNMALQLNIHWENRYSSNAICFLPSWGGPAH